MNSCQTLVRCKTSFMCASGCLFVSSALYLYLPLDVTVRLANTSYTVSESDGFVSLNVVREGLSSQTINITLTTTDGSALGEKSSHSCTIYNFLPNVKTWLCSYKLNTPIQTVHSCQVCHWRIQYLCSTGIENCEGWWSSGCCHSSLSGQIWQVKARRKPWVHSLQPPTVQSSPRNISDVQNQSDKMSGSMQPSIHSWCLVHTTFYDWIVNKCIAALSHLGTPRLPVRVWDKWGSGTMWDEWGCGMCEGVRVWG